MNEIPRRNNLERCVKAEITIDNAIGEVDILCGDSDSSKKLTEAIMMLQDARELVSDYVDEKLKEEARK